MIKNEYTSIEQFTSQYTGVWNPSENHWFGLDFIYRGVEYRFNTGSMYETDLQLPNGQEMMFGLYKKNNNVSKEEKEYELIGKFANMDDVLESIIDGRPFKDIILDYDTELTGQD